MAITEKATLCKQCGQDVGDSNFCPHCGAKVEWEEILRFEEVATKPTTGKKKSLGKVGLIVLGVAAVCVLLALLGHLFSSRNPAPRETPFAAEPSPSQPSESTFSESPNALSNTDGSGYREDLRQSECNLGLSFNMTLDNYISQYNRLGEETFGESYFLSVGVLDNDNMKLLDVWPNGIQHYIYNHPHGVNKWAVSVLVYDNYVVGAEISVAYNDVTKSNQNNPTILTFMTLLNESADKIQSRFGALAKQDALIDYSEEGIVFFTSEDSSKNVGNTFCLAMSKEAAKIMDESGTPFVLLEENVSPVIAPEALAIETLANNFYSNDSGEATVKELLDDMFLDPAYTAVENQDGSVTVTVTGNYRYARNASYSQSGNLILVLQFDSEQIAIDGEKSSISVGELAEYFDEYIADMNSGGGVVPLYYKSSHTSLSEIWLSDPFIQSKWPNRPLKTVDSDEGIPSAEVFDGDEYEFVYLDDDPANFDFIRWEYLGNWIYKLTFSTVYGSDWSDSEAEQLYTALLSALVDDPAKDDLVADFLATYSYAKMDSQFVLEINVENFEDGTVAMATYINGERTSMSTPLGGADEW